MKYKLADNAGFCFGVKRAIDTVDKLLKDEKEVISLGHLIHNKNEVSRLEKSGLMVTEDVNSIYDDYLGHIVIRSHGVGPEIYKTLENKKCILDDLTCPYVKKIHKIVLEEHKKNKKIIIFGNKKHPEIIGINSWTENSSIIVENIDEFKKIEFNKNKNYIACFQTTFNQNSSIEIISYLEKKYPDIKIYNTICTETNKRQEACSKLSESVDYMIIIGDLKSSNSKKLYQIASEKVDSVFVEDYTMLDREELKKHSFIGISAGASTPDYVIEEVVAFVENI